MGIILTDTEIESLICETKTIHSSDLLKKMRLRSKRGHYESQLNMLGENQSEFYLIFRKNMINELDFSVILAVKLPSTGRLFRLRRYNGLSHQHTNRIEREKFYDFHIHYATERYQGLGMSEDAYAIATDQYPNDVEAIQFALSDAHITVPDGIQFRLFT